MAKKSPRSSHEPAMHKLEWIVCANRILVAAFVHEGDARRFVERSLEEFGDCEWTIVARQGD